jgi:hypothetical protein
MEEYRLPKRAIEMKITNCKGPMGRPQMRWLNWTWDQEVRNG